MDAQAIVTISAAVTALTQFLKWAGIQDKYGPIMVMTLSAIGVAVFAFSLEERPDLRQAWIFFSTWIAVVTSAAGIFGFTRAGSDAVTATRNPPSGAGQNPTNKD